MRVSVALDDEQISQLVYDELKMSLECFLEDLESDSPNVFSMSPIYDKMLILKHIEALELIMEWYKAP